MGFLHMQDENYVEAVNWFKLALQVPKPADPGAVIDHSCWTWLPHLQLCVCYDHMGQLTLACAHNDVAGTFVPNDDRVLTNKKYFEKKLAGGSGG
jgi:hypothetical protein